MKETKTGILQGSPVSTILFAIHIAGIFQEIEQEVMGAKGLSFLDDISWLVSGTDITEITKLLEACGKAAKPWADRNMIEFDIIKNEAILFSKSKKCAAMTINLDGRVKVKYNKRATQWLGFWLDSALNFKEKHTKRMAKAHHMESQIKRLHSKFGMTPVNLRKIMIATVQSAALFILEIWWRGQKNREEEIQAMLN